MRYIQGLVSITKQLELLFSPAPKKTLRRTTSRAPSDPVLHKQWCQIRRRFFPDRSDIDAYTVSWSTRTQKRVLASCNIHRRKILVAKELNSEVLSQWIEPILYHEMCHAVIGHGVALSPSGKRQWHGREFKALEARHPDIPALDKWISSGGWAKAVRSHRSKQAWAKRRSETV
jgi:hypothetical protein